MDNEMNVHKNIQFIIMCLAFTSMVLTGCLEINTFGPCEIPRDLTVEGVTGTWYIMFTNQLDGKRVRSTPDEEVLIIDESGVYSHTFASGDYTHEERGHWEVVMDAPDSPKLRMYGMKYFAAGVETANTVDNIDLSAQMADRLRIQEYNKTALSDDRVNKGVSYPSEGFIYLYPRLCNNELSLLQMVNPDDLDPDDRAVKNPIFRQKEF